MATEDNSWRTPAFRQNMIAKLDDALTKSGKPVARTATEMENQVFSKVKTREDYVNYIARLLIYVSPLTKKTNPGMGPAMNNPGQNMQQGMQDPIGALQNLARQGTGNERGISGMPVAGPNAQPMVPQQPPGPNPPNNLLQTLNQRSGQQMNMQGMHNKIPGMAMIPGQGGCPPMNVNHMGQMQNMQNNSMTVQMNPMNQGNIQPAMGPQGNQQQMPGGQMSGQQIGPGQVPQSMPNQMQPVQNQMNNHQLSQMNPNMPPQQQPPTQHQQTQHINQISASQLAANQIPQAQLGHMQRKTVEMMNAGFPGPRNVTPTQFLRQSPSPSAPSPGGLGAPNPASNQMVASPLVPSPNPQHTMLSGAQRSVGMVSSPGSSLNTPAGASGATPSPLQDEQAHQAYKEKIRKLSIYIEPLKKMIKLNTEGNNEKTIKMKKLLELLTNPSSSTKLDVLNKCEIVLEKMDLKKIELGTPTIPSNLKENHIFHPLLEVVSNVLQSHVANHTLHRTFGPCLEALFGPDIKDLPPPIKKQKIEDNASDIPDVLQGEIARLDQKFKISLDPAQKNGSKTIQLICWLDDKHLPCVPPISVIVPADYPTMSPRCILASHEYATPYLNSVQKALDARLAKLPKRFSLSQLLDTWEISVRQASAPKLQLPIILIPNVNANESNNKIGSNSVNSTATPANSSTNAASILPNAGNTSTS